MTNTATQFIENKDDVEKFLPSVSVCPLPAFKKPGPQKLCVMATVQKS